MKNIIGYLSEEEGKTLQKYAAKCSEVVEIGTFQGKSAITMALVCDKVYTIDPYKYRLFEGYAEEYGVADKIERIISPSALVKWDRPIEMIFIDGLHHKVSVRNDYKKFAPFIVKNGMLIFHDTQIVQVREFIEEEPFDDFIVKETTDNMLCLIRK